MEQRNVPCFLQLIETIDKPEISFCAVYVNSAFFQTNFQIFRNGILLCKLYQIVYKPFFVHAKHLLLTAS